MDETARHRDARHLLLERKVGILSTLSVEVAGFPFGSLVPYCLDRAGRPLLLIADIAQHTRNVLADPRASLTVAEERPAGDPQAGARLTYLARAERLADPRPQAGRYYRHFPWTRDYHRTHGFAFFRLEPVRVRYIGGFGDIRWISPAAFTLPNPFSAEQEAAIADHMDADHQEAMRRYCRQLKGLPCDDGQPVAFAGIDAEGFDLLFERRLLRFAFERPVDGPAEARQRLVELAAAAG